MSFLLTRIALLVSPMLLSSLLAGAALAEDPKVYPGAPADERVARCGITVSGNEIARIAPFLEGRVDLEGRLELEVMKRGPAGQSRSRQAGNFAKGRLGTMMMTMEGPAELAIVLSVKDRSGKTLCSMRRSIVLGSISFKI